MSNQRALVGRALLDAAPSILRTETIALASLEVQLTHRQYRILRQVSGGTTSMTTLSKAAGISVAAISESADALFRRGLLEREADENDRRASKLSLSKQGDQALRAAEAAMDQLADVLVKDLSTTELAQLSAALVKVNETLKQQVTTEEGVSP